MGILGVDLFFVLSGFVLTYTYFEQMPVFGLRSSIKFLGLRLARIYPLHVALLLVLAALLFATSVSHVVPHRPEGFTASTFVANALLVQGWTLHDTLGSWNYAAWSISAEWFAYLLFPGLLVALAVLKSPRQLLIALWIAILAQLALHAWLFPQGGPLIRIVPEFILGCLLCRVFTLRIGARLPWGVIATACMVGGPLVAVTALHHGWPIAIAVPLFAGLILAIASGKGWTLRVLGSRPFVFLGEASYALYMTHGIVAMIGDRVAPLNGDRDLSMAVRLGLVAIYVVVILATALGAFIWIERPSRRVLKRKLDRWMPGALRGQPAAEPAIPDIRARGPARR